MHGESRVKGYYCTMVKGPCRGALCDFWARTKIKKASIDELVLKARESILECSKDNGGVALDKALEKFWKDFGIKSMESLCKEDPKLCQKVGLVQSEILS